ncbi:hypothetical protein CEXT_757901 [Caerostris extrusa]|uniref:Uncharacterized protein n=1 Tax=Caerostris extrusa TaxID=172846 RepID=A0AAV4P6T9_CAEEX|nr:hypothetical protein CEXT_757901 [Caerostris extrusa]
MRLRFKRFTDSVCCSSWIYFAVGVIGYLFVRKSSEKKHLNLCGILKPCKLILLVCAVHMFLCFGGGYPTYQLNCLGCRPEYDILENRVSKILTEYLQQEQVSELLSGERCPLFRGSGE